MMKTADKALAVKGKNFALDVIKNEGLPAARSRINEIQQKYDLSFYAGYKLACDLCYATSTRMNR